jgi:hypothetical protein
MTIPFGPANSSGSLFLRWGKLLGRLADLNSLGGGTVTSNVLSGANMPTNFNTIETDFALGTPLRQVIDGLLSQTLPSFQSGNQTIFPTISNYVLSVLRAMVAIDVLGVPSNAPLSQFLSACSSQFAVQTLVNQMTANSITINASVPAFGAQTNVGTPTGTPAIYGTMVAPNGMTQQYVYPETLTFACTRDSYTGGVAAGSEQMSITGYPQVQSTYSPLWPGGSGVVGSVTCINGALNYSGNPQQNVLQNSDFVTNTTANQADNWNYVTGAAGTDFFISTANAYTPSGGSLQILGTGAALQDCATQSFNVSPTATVNAGGTSYALTPLTEYIMNVWIKVGASTPAAGVLQFALVYGAGAGTIMNDQQGNANSVSFNLTAGGINLSTTYVPVQFVFRTPALLPATTPYKLRVQLTTAISSGKSLYLGRMACVAVPSPLYPGGPYGPVVFSGATPLVNGPYQDQFQVGVTNVAGLFQQWLWATINPGQYGVVIPAGTSSPTISDGLLI